MWRNWWLSLLLAAGGCGSSEFPLAPVSGKVTVDGAPVAGARINFETKRQGAERRSGPGSYATTDEEGRYRLETLFGYDGAVIGPHTVWITTLEVRELEDGTEEILVEERIPERYGDGIPFTVPEEGTEQADFQLTTN
ncbi:MAG: hypothetical protein GTO62_03955 [Planctomycetales bacterium]|nr:hypothetical protein [Planctomycetales bacterium]NIP68410.1 hypothetical protein [Planctomycetales bacterium]